MQIDNGFLSQHTAIPESEISAKEGSLRFATWAVFLSAAAFLLRPVLLTAIAADDLINPFAQIYHAGTGMSPILRRTWDSVSATGHFNYVGQTFGSFVVAIWNYLIGNFGIRYSFVYASTKYLVYILCIEISARTLRQTLNFVGTVTDIWPMRISILLAIALPIQIHIPWSNDPVASYPLSGYLTATVGIAFVLLIFKLIKDGGLWFSTMTGIYGACAVLYYEFNSFAVLSVAPILGYFIWRSKDEKKALRSSVAKSFIAILPAATTTIFFYFKNRAASADYSGTAISLADPFVKTFTQGFVSVFPGSSWKLAFDWLPNSLVYPTTYWKQLFIGFLSVALILLFRRRWTPVVKNRERSLFQLLIATSPFFIYWIGATFTQTSTVKVQQEAVRIGQVYNYYAVGAVCLAIVLVFVLTLVNWSRVLPAIKILLLTGFLSLGAFQYFINWNVTTQFNGALSGNRNLLVAFAERPPMPERCAALDAWKSMGWPEYYWLDMELGMNASYEIYHGEQFCKR